MTVDICPKDISTFSLQYQLILDEDRPSVETFGRKNITRVMSMCVYQLKFSCLGCNGIDGCDSSNCEPRFTGHWRIIDTNVSKHDASTENHTYHCYWGMEVYVCIYVWLLPSFSLNVSENLVHNIVPMFYSIVSHFKVTMATQIVRVTYPASVKHIQSNLILYDFQRHRPP